MSGLPWEDDENETAETVSVPLKNSGAGSAGLLSEIETLEALSNGQDEAVDEQNDDEKSPSSDAANESEVVAVDEGRSTIVSVAELSAMGLPANDGFWIAPANFDDFLEEWNAAESDEPVAAPQEPSGGDEEPDQGEQEEVQEEPSVEPVAAPVEPTVVLDVPNLGPNAPAALPRRSAQLNRYARPTLNPNDPVKKAMIANIAKANNERRIG